MQGVTWYTARIRAITVTIPQRAHQLAAAQAAGLAAKGIESKGTGHLARDVATPKPVGFMRTQVGSGLPYARIENDGGVIVPVRAKRLLIRGTRGGTTRSTVGGEIVASALAVTHRGKHYLDRARYAFPRLFTDALRRMM